MAQPFAFAELRAQVMLLPATAPSNTTHSLSRYSTTLLGSSKTDAKKPLRSEHSLFLANLLLKLANGIRTRPNRGQQSNLSSRSTWAFAFIRRFQTPNLQPMGTSWLLVIVMPAAIRKCRDHALNLAILNYPRFLYEVLIDHRHFFNFNTSFPCILLVDMGMSTL